MDRTGRAQALLAAISMLGISIGVSTPATATPSGTADGAPMVVGDAQRFAADQLKIDQQKIDSNQLKINQHKAQQQKIQQQKVDQQKIDSNQLKINTR